MRHIFFSFLLACTTICHASPNLTTSACNCDLPAPQNLKAEEVGTTYATLRWDAVAGAVGYQVSLLDTLDALISTTFTAETTAFEEDLEPGLTYKYRVAAVCLGGGISTLYSIVAIKPVIVDLVISLEKPRGLFDIICEKDIVGSAECSFNAATNSSIIGEVSRTSTGEKMKFQLRYVIENGIPKIILNEVDESYENIPFIKPQIKSDKNNIEDKNIKYAIAFSNEQYIYRITISTNGYLNFKVLIDKPYYNDLKFSLITTSPTNNPGMKLLSKKRPGDIIIFPNPSSSNITLLTEEKQQGDLTLYLHRLDGTICKVINLSFENPTFPIEDLENGIYILKFVHNSNDYAIKLVKFNQLNTN